MRANFGRAVWYTGRLPVDAGRGTRRGEGGVSWGGVWMCSVPDFGRSLQSYSQITLRWPFFSELQSDYVEMYFGSGAETESN
eukprot:424199-Pyramimonas_sp.AAC.2